LKTRFVLQYAPGTVDPKVADCITNLVFNGVAR